MRKSGVFGRGSSRNFDDSKSNISQNRMKTSMHRITKRADFDPKQFIVAQCSEHDIEVFKQVFDFLDDDHDSVLTPLDLRKAIKDYGGYKPGRTFVYVAMSFFDTDSGGEISFRQFVKLLTQKPYQSDTNEDIERVFQNFDQQTKGYISEEDLLKAAEQLHEDLTLAQVKQMIKRCDPNGDGVIRLESFISFNKRKSFE